MFKKGFTLIELLVVIAIIAILAAILFPVFAQVREKARQASCISNLKQLGTAFQLYVDDWDEVLPQMMRQYLWLEDTSYPQYYYNSFNWERTVQAWGMQSAVDTYNPENIWATNWYTWMDAIFPYVKNVGLYHCPTTMKGAASYGANMFIMSSNGWAQSASLSELTNTGDKVLLCSGVIHKDYNGRPAIYCGAHPGILGTADAWASIASRHNGNINFAFCDGHAKAYRGEGPAKSDGTQAFYDKYCLRK